MKCPLAYTLAIVVLPLKHCGFFNVQYFMKNKSGRGQDSVVST